MKNKGMLVILIILFVACLACGSIGYFQSTSGSKDKGNDVVETPTIKYLYYLEDVETTLEGVTNSVDIDENTSSEIVNNDYIFSSYSCTNGLTGEFDSDKWEFVPNEEIDSTCKLYFNKTKYEVTLTVTNGELDKNNNKYIEREKNGEFIIKPYDGYEYDSSTCSNNKVPVWSNTDNKLTISTIMEDVTCKVVFKIKSISMKLTVVNGTGNTTETVEYGKSITSVIQPNAGFEKPTITCTNNQVATANNNIVTIEKLTDDTTCVATYSAVPLENYTLSINTIPATINISKGGLSQTVQKGSNGEFTLQPETGFAIDQVVCTVVPQIIANNDGTTTYKFTGMTKDIACTVTAKES